MPSPDDRSTETAPQSIAFKAETRQLLNILIHSLYTDRDIFLRELVSNASDALYRLDFELLTNREIKDPELPLEIRLSSDPENRILTISDTGIGMTAEEMAENLGTIAHSGARAFVEAAAQNERNLDAIIGQFGVGFYSAFMVAEWIKVVSRSYRPEAEAAEWYSDGSETYTLGPAEREQRGTSVIIKLKEDAIEFAQETRLKEVIRKHSDFVAYPIYIGDSEEQANRQTALWRQQPREVKTEEYHEFYKQFSLDFQEPLAYTHMVVDAPVQAYAVLFVPSNPESSIFTLRREPGLKLYSRKILIQEYSKDLLPEYLGFIQGVVDSEDLPLNVSRESVQANRILVNLKKVVTTKALEMLKKLAKDNPDTYARFWEAYGRFLKQGVATEPDKPEELYTYLRFRTTRFTDSWTSLDEYVGRMKPDQRKIYFILGDDERSVLHSPHLDVVQHYGYEVLLMTDPLDSFMLVRLKEYQGFPLVNVANADLKLPEAKSAEDEATADSEKMDPGEFNTLLQRARDILGDRVSDVRLTDRLSQSPARLVDPEGSPDQEIQRVYRYLEREYTAPKKILELNPHHKIVLRLQQLPSDNELAVDLIEQLYENALLIEGLHPDPAGMITRLQKIMEAALD